MKEKTKKTQNKKKTTDWLEKHRTGSQIIFDIAYNLQTLSRLFYRTGNYKIGEELHFYSEELQQAHKMISQSVTENIKDELKNSQEMSTLILKSALSGIKLQRTQKNDP